MNDTLPATIFLALSIVAPNTSAAVLADNTTTDDWIAINGGSVHCPGGNFSGFTFQFDRLSDAANPGVFSNADFSGANLQFAQLGSAVVVGADFTGADLGAVAPAMDARFANFTNADMSAINATGANFAGADFSGADLSVGNFTGADLRGADFTFANGSVLNTNGALYDRFTIFNPGFDPEAAGMILVPEPSRAMLLGVAMASILLRRRRGERMPRFRQQ